MFYCLYLGDGIYKAGCVEDYTRLSKRIDEHKRESIKMVKLFTDEANIQRPGCALKLFDFKTSQPKGCEEACMNLLRTFPSEIQYLKIRVIRMVVENILNVIILILFIYILFQKYKKK